MAENKTKPTVQSVEAFLDTVPDVTRRADAKALATLMAGVTGEEATMWGIAIVGFGRYRYRCENGREGENMLAGFSPRKAGLAVYGVTGFIGAEALLGELGKYARGKGCLYIKRMAEVDAAVLKALVAGAVAATRARSVE